MSLGALDPEISEGLEGVGAFLAETLSTLSPETLATVRSVLDTLPAPALSDAVVRTDHSVESQPGLIVRMHRPVGHTSPLPGLYWMHGGGLILGNRFADDLRFDRWCQELGIIGFSVEYRLAPEHPYPAALEDCYAGLLWVITHATELGVDPTRLGVGGSSAGGGLAACLSLAARDRSGPDISFAALLYPMLDDRPHGISDSWPDPVWPPAANVFAWSSYLGDSVGTDDVSSLAAAARAQNLSGLPPTLLSVGALDCFSDQTVSYAERLRHAGVPTELHVYPGAPHGFDDLVPSAKISQRFTDDVLDWIQRHLA